MLFFISRFWFSVFIKLPLKSKATVRSADKKDDASETDQSDAESESAFNSEKIGSEHRQIRQRERLEEQRTAKIEAKRVWLIKSIQKCSKTQNLLQVSFATVNTCIMKCLDFLVAF